MCEVEKMKEITKTWMQGRILLSTTGDALIGAYYSAPLEMLLLDLKSDSKECEGC
jgi:hypothetical protein